ncbi:hypothetical protein ACE0DR_01020 [Azotobacter sp. CWF10]
MTITVYSSLDTGAPALPSVGGQRFIDNLKLILKACLVDGYGSKPAAGWTVGHDHADGFSLGNGFGFVNFVSTASDAVAVYLMESITDGSSALAGGYNRRSGPWFDGQADAGRHYHRGAYFYSTYANKQWCVVADGRTAILLWYASSTVVDNDFYTGGLLYVGEYKQALGNAGFCAIGGRASSNPPYFFDASDVSGTSLRNPFDGTVAQGSSPGYRAASICEGSSAALVNRTKLAPSQLRPVRVAMVGRGAGVSGSTTVANDAQCGLLRGLISEPSLSDVYLSKVLTLLNGSSPAYQDKIRPVSMPDGSQWVPVYAHVNDRGAFISLAASDWE